MWQASMQVLTQQQKHAASLLLTCLVVRELHLQDWGLTHQLRNNYKAVAWADAA
jgi:hypothetical protein